MLFVVDQNPMANIYNMRTSLACAARAGGHKVSARGVHLATGLTLINKKGDNISKYFCLMSQ